LPKEWAKHQGAEIIMPDNGIVGRAHAAGAPRSGSILEDKFPSA